MCTVTYLPVRRGFILTHNRDEAPARSPKTLSVQPLAQERLVFPRDTKAGGTWIALSDRGRAACLLNGAFVKHKHEPPYRRSRGLVLLDFFEWPDPEDFFNRYDLDGIEPFTFLYFAETLTELRWDGATRHLLRLAPDKAHFWCSATLYPPEMQQRREAVFRDWYARRQQEPDPAKLRRQVARLHRTGSVGDPENDYVMNRNGRVQTVSISQIACTTGHALLTYADLLEGSVRWKRITP